MTKTVQADVGRPSFLTEPKVYGPQLGDRIGSLRSLVGHKAADGSGWTMVEEFHAPTAYPHGPIGDTGWVTAYGAPRQKHNAIKRYFETDLSLEVIDSTQGEGWLALECRDAARLRDLDYATPIVLQHNLAIVLERGRGPTDTYRPCTPCPLWPPPRRVSLETGSRMFSLRRPLHDILGVPPMFVIGCEWLRGICSSLPGALCAGCSGLQRWWRGG